MLFTKLTILFSGMIAADPYQGGATWAVLQYLLGLRKLGHEIYFIEPLPEKSFDSEGEQLDHSINAAYFRQVMTEFSLEQNSALLIESNKQTVGLSYEKLKHLSSHADLLINVSGMLRDEELISNIPLRVYLDLDPAFNQIWHFVYGIDMRFAAHNRFVTVGKSVGQENCRVPTCGIEWTKTFQPVVLDYWTADSGIIYDGLTTIANWRGYGSVEFEGVFYGQKAHSLRPLMNLPTLTDEKFMPALTIHPDESKDLAALKENNWRLLDPLELTATPASYRHFVQGSKAEFGIAKSGYVASRCGWFSDRSACYLASGRPVIAQETGFSDFLPTGKGLFAFKTAEDVIESINAINADYHSQSRAARSLAEELFDSDKVLTKLLREVGATT